MCRKNQLLGVLLVGIGVGLMIACRASSVFWCTCFGLGAVVFGVTLLQKTRL